MTTIVPFRQRAEPTMEGPARCIGCGHDWQAVAPQGAWQLECPSCHTMKGVFRHPVGAVDGDLFFACLCGCEALTAYQRSGRFWLRCMKCGTDQTEAVFG